MKHRTNLKMKLILITTSAGLAIAAALLLSNPTTPVAAQNVQAAAAQKVPGAAAVPIPAAGNAVQKGDPAAKPADAAAAAAAAPPAGAQPPPPGAPIAPAAAVPPADAQADATPATEDMQVSFQGANIDMVVQWLAKVTGKSVVKHPRVQCQLTIVGSKKLSPREAINLVYGALGLEGFSAVETSKSILIVPEGQEPKTGAELIDPTRTELPEGRQRLMKIFPLKNIQAAELKEKIRAVVSEKATMEIADRSNQLIVTDFTDNIRLIGELIKELDVPAGGDTVIEFYSLKFSEAEELGNLLTLVLNAQAGSPSSSSRSSSQPSRGGPIPPGVVLPPGASPEQPPGGGAPPSPGASASGPQQFRIWPDKTANRLIVAAPKSKLPEVKRLIDLLDTEKPRDVSIRVLQLKNVSAEDVVRELGPLYQKMSGKSLKDTIEVTASTRANSLVVLSSEVNFRAIQQLVASLDTEEAQEKVMRAFPLKNAEAEDVAKQLQDLNQDQDGMGRYPYFIYGMSQPGRGPKKPSFVADRRRNTIIVQAAPAAMENIAKLIEQLDAPVSDNSLAPKIFRLKYVSAADIEDVLNEIFLKKQQTRTYWDQFGFPTTDRSDQGGGRLAGKIRITSEPYSNAIIVTSNSPENLAAVEEVLKQLDVSSQAGESTFRINLRFAKASTLANSLNILFARGGAPPLRPTPQQGQPGFPVQQQQQQQQSGPQQASFELEQETKEDAYFPWLGGQQDNVRGADGRNVTRPISDLIGRVRVVADQRSNSLLISANLHLFPQVMKLIEELDAPTAQVLIDARLVEVSSDYMDRLGVRWSPDGGATFTAEDLDNSIISHVKGRYVQDFGGTRRTSTIADSMTAIRSGIIDSTINLDFLIQFLRKTTEATVLAEPQINVADNELGRLFVGQQIPFISQSQTTDVGSLNQSFTYKNVGVILEVTPHINNSGDVALRVRTEASAIVPGQTLFGGAIVDTRNFKTDLTVKNGQTLVLGGIIQRQLSDTFRKTPILGSIPGLGWAFKKKDKTQREVELLVFLRPKVVRTAEEAKELMEEEEKKAPLIKRSMEDYRPNKEQEDTKPNSEK